MNKEPTMTRLSLLLILGLAAGCDNWTENRQCDPETGECVPIYTQGCAPTPNSSVIGTVDTPLDSVIDLNEDSPTFGQCIGRAASGGGTGATGGSGPGTGGAGGGGLFPPVEGETNLGTCGSTTDPDNLNCDYGCTALNNVFGFVAVLAVDPEDSLAAGSSTETAFNGFFIVSEAFIAGANAAFGTTFEAATIPEGATLPITALEGATGPDLTLTLEQITLDLTADPDGNGDAGPFALPFVPDTQTYTYGDSGTDACFNLTVGTQFIFGITDPFPLPAEFNCQPANQDLINADNVPCSSNADCPEPSTCDTAARECFAVIVSEPTAGQVCITVPGAGGGTGGAVGTGGSGGT